MIDWDGTNMAVGLQPDDGLAIAFLTVVREYIKNVQGLYVVW